MFKKLTPLKQSDHGHLRLLPVTDYDFARGELVAPIVIDEIAEVVREYPIVFPVGSDLPVALMGVEKDRNAYVGPDGQWLGAYIPAHIRHYPLAIARVPAPEDGADKRGERFVVLIDEAADVLSPGDGDPLFGEDGKLAPAGEQLTHLMEQMQHRSGITQRLVQAIDAAGLLAERAIRIKREGEAVRQVTGIRVIDEAALNNLDDSAFDALRKSGALALVYASLLSRTNLRLGPIGRSHPLPAWARRQKDDLVRVN